MGGNGRIWRSQRRISIFWLRRLRGWEGMVGVPRHDFETPLLNKG